MADADKIGIIALRAAEAGVGPGDILDAGTAARLTSGLRVYVASPYGDSEPAEVRAGRYRGALDVCGRLIAGGARAYSPIVHTHHVAEAGHAPPDGWYAHDLDMLVMFDVLVVAMMPGWERSQGVELETRRAVQAGIPVLRVRPVQPFT